MTISTTMATGMRTTGTDTRVMDMVTTSTAITVAYGAMTRSWSIIGDAVRPFGVKDILMPCTPERIWRAISEASDSSKGEQL